MAAAVCFSRYTSCNLVVPSGKRLQKNYGKSQFLHWLVVSTPLKILVNGKDYLIYSGK